MSQCLLVSPSTIEENNTIAAAVDADGTWQRKLATGTVAVHAQKKLCVLKETSSEQPGATSASEASVRMARKEGVVIDVTNVATTTNEKPECIT